MVEVAATPAQVNKPSAKVKPLGDNVEVMAGETSHEDMKEQLKTGRFFDPTDKMVEGRVVMVAEGAEAPTDTAGNAAEADAIREAIAKRAKFDAEGRPVVTSGYYNPVKLNPVNPDELAPMEEVVVHPDSKAVSSSNPLVNKPIANKVSN